MIIRDRIWSPVVKLGATPESRRYHFPIESVYAASEIKQTLGFQELDDAMEKLVKISRLTRPNNPYGHVTENQHLPLFDKRGWILNPLHTTVIGTNIQSGISFRDMGQRFGEINACLGRKEMVTMLCVLGHGLAWFSVKDGDAINATFMWDRDQCLQMSIYDHIPDNTFYYFFMLLAGHLHRSVLGSQDISASYGTGFEQYDNVSWNKTVYNSDARRRTI